MSYNFQTRIKAAAEFQLKEAHHAWPSDLRNAGRGCLGIMYYTGCLITFLKGDGKKVDQMMAMHGVGLPELYKIGTRVTTVAGINNMMPSQFPLWLIFTTVASIVIKDGLMVDMTGAVTNHAGHKIDPRDLVKRAGDALAMKYVGTNADKFDIDRAGMHTQDLKHLTLELSKIYRLADQTATGCGIVSAFGAFASTGKLGSLNVVDTKLAAHSGIDFVHSPDVQEAWVQKTLHGLVQSYIKDNGVYMGSPLFATGANKAGGDLVVQVGSTKYKVQAKGTQKTFDNATAAVNGYKGDPALWFAGKACAREPLGIENQDFVKKVWPKMLSQIYTDIGHHLAQ